MKKPTQKIKKTRNSYTVTIETLGEYGQGNLMARLRQQLPVALREPWVDSSDGFRKPIPVTKITVSPVGES